MEEPEAASVARAGAGARERHYDIAEPQAAGGGVIVGPWAQLVDIDAVVADPDNYRVHDAANLDLIRKSIEENGAGRSILVRSDDAGTLHLIAGEGTTAAARAAGITQVLRITPPPGVLVAVDRPDLSPEEAARMALFDNATTDSSYFDENRLGQLAEFNPQMLAGIFTEDMIDAFRNNVSNQDIDDQKETHKGVSTRNTGQKAAFKAAENQQKWEVKSGQIWEIPSATLRGRSHRLICGSSTALETLPALCGQDRPLLAVTSPPYYNQRPDYAIYASYAEYLDIITQVVANVATIAGKPFILGWNIGDNQVQHIPLIADNIKAIQRVPGLIYLENIIWAKLSAGYSFVPRNAHIRTNNFYYPSLAWEAIVVFRIGEDQPHFEAADADLITTWDQNVWSFNTSHGDAEKYGHPAVYPLELPHRLIRCYTKRGAIVLDPFAGSGSTMEAAESDGRICYAAELLPEYCSSILERMDLLGLHPALLYDPNDPDDAPAAERDLDDLYEIGAAMAPPDELEDISLVDAVATIRKGSD